MSGTDDDFLPLPGEDGPPSAIDPTAYASWLYIRHGTDDDGRRPKGWWWHNQEFSADRSLGSVLVTYTLANKGWMNADAIQLDYLIVSGAGVTVISKDFQLKSGYAQSINEGFDVLGDKPEDAYDPVGALPWLAIRATDLTTPAPSLKDISNCLLAFSTDRPSATETLMRWKRYPSLFIYPCCALFTGSPQR